MSYECSNCCKEIEDEFLVVQENHVILALLNDVENCFCSQQCVNDFLMIESKYLSNGDIPYDDEEVEQMEEIIMAWLPNKELNRLIKIENAVENLIENGILDEDVFNQYLKEA